MNPTREYGVQALVDPGVPIVNQSGPLRSPEGIPDAASGKGVDRILMSLLGVLRDEAEILNSNSGEVDASLTRQKLQLMMQLNRVTPARGSLSESTRDLLVEAKELLAANASMLDRRMTAIREIASMISKEINDAQSDGTYDVSRPAHGYAGL